MENNFQHGNFLWRLRTRHTLANIEMEEELLRWKYQRFAKNYLRCIRDVDENIGQNQIHL